MTGPANGSRARGLVVLRVVDSINPALAGRAVASYESPPQPHEQAMTLVRLLVGWPVVPLDQETHWRCPIAGGVRTVTLSADTNCQTGQASAGSHRHGRATRRAVKRSPAR